MWRRLQSVCHGEQRSRGACCGEPSMIVRLRWCLYSQLEEMRLWTAFGEGGTEDRVIIIMYICIGKDINNLIFFEIFNI